MDLQQLKELVQPADTKIVMLIMDGVGGSPTGPDNKTELERAETPNLDALAAKSVCGLHEPVGPGITPGSGPSHLAVFGYDPLKYQVGRGVLAALGVNYPLGKEDVAARGNFCTIDENGAVTDRRAGRISTEKNQELCGLLNQIEVPGVKIEVQTVKEHRFLIVISGTNLSGDIEDTDPQVVGRYPLDPMPRSDAAKQTAEAVKIFQDKARDVLKDHHPANMVLLRGFAQFPDWPQMDEAFGLRAAAIAGYPMYRGVAKLVGMNALDTGDTVASEIDTLKAAWNDYDFFYVHVKKTDSAGEDGDVDKKVHLIEETDQLLPRILDLKPDVMIVTGDHSTPAVLKAHSWHPVPVMICGEHCRPDTVEKFGERACLAGALGPRMPAFDIMPIALANAMRLEKFGA